MNVKKDGTHYGCRLYLFVERQKPAVNIKSTAGFLTYNNSGVVLCDPGKKARVTTVKNDLKALQNMVDGPIECVYPYGIICDEEGKLEQLEPNRSLRDDQGKIYDVIAGRFMVVGLGYDDFDSLSDALCEKYVKLFEYPELFYREGNEIKSIKVELHEVPRRSKGR